MVLEAQELPIVLQNPIIIKWRNVVTLRQLAILVPTETMNQSDSSMV